VTCRHDLNLPAWGPYTKWYAGISHIADQEKGLRFDLSVFPGYYRRSKIDIPNVMWESGYHPWEAASDLGYYSYRHELEWKDQVYADVSFSKINDNARLIRCEMVNNTDQELNLVLHYMAALCFDTPGMNGGAHGNEPPHNAVDVNAPREVLALHALDYSRMAYATGRPTDNLMPDGLFRGEIRRNDFTEGSALGRGDFGLEAGDMVAYRFTLSSDVRDCVVQIRYFALHGGAQFSVSGDFLGGLDLAEGNGPQFAVIELGDIKAGPYEIVLTSAGKGSAIMDSLLIGAAQEVAKAEYIPRRIDHTPQMLDGPVENSVVLKYAASKRYYGLYWDFPDYWVRQIRHGELDKFLRFNTHDHVRKILTGDGRGHFANVFMRPVTIGKKSSQAIYGIVLDAETSEKAFSQIKTLIENKTEYDGFYEKARKGRFEFHAAPPGETFRKSQELMAAVNLTNVVFPIYTRRKYVRHYTPGKWWDCLYTWDNGFIGIGLSVLDIGRAIDTLNMYLTPDGDTHCAFIHHGSMVPVQFYLFQEIWNKTRDEKLLAYFYPRLRQYYQFYAGKSGSSTTAMPSGLLKTWDYFYNSGGWDDYPPQFFSHANGLTPNNVTPASNTAHAIRCGRILAMAARRMGGFDADIAEYAADENRFAQALQTYSWDEEAGYFSYTLHNDHGIPSGILRHESGQNFNMGLDGVEPIITGTLTQRQEERLVSHILDPGGLWSEIGLSTVDRSAKYYKKDGYWNGAVWMPHQWFIFKAMLDTGRGDIAYNIADRALAIWKDETERTYNCCEHFIIASGRGAGWHHFGGLSNPVLYWYQAYFVPGNLTTGYDVWVDSLEFSEGDTSMSAQLILYGASRLETVLIARMSPGRGYAASFNGINVKVQNRLDGAVEITIPNTMKEGKLLVSR